MPFINRKPLNYPINSESSIRIFEDDRAPTTADYKNFIVGDEWWDKSSNDFWKLVFKDGTQGIWRKMAGTAAAAELFTPDVGGQVGPDGLNNINLLGGGGITTTGNPGTNTITIAPSNGGSLLETLTADAGGAVGPDGSANINIVGGAGVTTTGNPGTNTISIALTGGGTAIDTITGDSGGAVGPDGAGNINLTGGTSGFTFVGNPGTFTQTFTGVDQQQIIYVGKHGNDANDGSTIEKAMLTISAGITAATAIAPAVVLIEDAGDYTESITLVSNVSLHAPNATLTGNIILSDNSHIRLFSIVTSSGNSIFKSSGTGISSLMLGTIVLTGTANGIVNNTGSLNVAWRKMTIVDGVGVFDASPAAEEIHITAEDVEISGTGTGISRVGAGNTAGDIDYITDSGSGTALNCTAGELNITINKIETNTGITVSGGEANIDCEKLDAATTAYNVSAGATLNLDASVINGTQTAAAGSFVNGANIEVGNFTNTGYTLVNPETTNTLYAVSNVGASTFNNAFTFPTTDGTLGQALITDGGGNVTWQTEASSGEMVQYVNTSRNTVLAASTVIPNDNSIPQNTEGDEVFTLSITPKSATNILVIKAIICGVPASSGTIALFQDATVNALAAGAVGGDAAGDAFMAPITHQMVAGTTSSTTFKIRVGISGGGSSYFVNANPLGVQLYGGVASTTLEIWEIKV